MVLICAKNMSYNINIHSSPNSSSSSNQLPQHVWPFIQMLILWKGKKKTQTNTTTQGKLEKMNYLQQSQPIDLKKTEHGWDIFDSTCSFFKSKTYTEHVRSTAGNSALQNSFFSSTFSHKHPNTGLLFNDLWRTRLSQITISPLHASHCMLWHLFPP